MRRQNERKKSSLRINNANEWRIILHLSAFKESAPDRSNTRSNSRGIHNYGRRCLYLTFDRFLSSHSLVAGDVDEAAHCIRHLKKDGIRDWKSMREM